ncbi:MAG: hypothetical protein QS98_C0003G0059 [archaeon GW2011_AR3]|nr:MAG: hypothetical protein QS98_C0003G0059 [archaeon GW2011_AR3]MBS3110101.1 DUF58 domain-containing protein [Candidatus Woesearchaeota archaeon]
MAIKTDFLRQLDKFQLIIKKKVTSSYSGPRESREYGRGLVFKDHKEYVAGDDFRTLDWNVYARTENFYIKRYEEERNLTVHIIIDGSASMNYGKDIKKFEYAAMIGLGFAYMALKNNEKFVFSLFSDKLEPLRPRKGTQQMMELLQYLNNHKITGKTKIGDAMQAYKKFISSRSLVVIISDLLIDSAELKEILPQFKKHELKVIQVLDPMEKELDLTGDLVLHDAETNLLLRTFVSRRLREKYKGRLMEHSQEVENVCAKLNAKFISVTTDTPVFDVFAKILR